MKRRNFIGSLAAAITAAGIGIATTHKGQLEQFAEFFEKRNGFKMNGFQIAAYISYEKGQRFYFPSGRGMTTLTNLFHTIAHYEHTICNKSVLYVCGNGWLIERKDRDIKACWQKSMRESFLCGKRYDIVLYDLPSMGIDQTMNSLFPLNYFAETVVTRNGVIKKRNPNFNV